MVQLANGDGPVYQYSRANLEELSYVKANLCHC